MSPKQHKEPHDPLLDSLFSEVKQAETSIKAPIQFRRTLRSRLLKLTQSQKTSSITRARYAIGVAILSLAAIWIGVSSYAEPRFLSVLAPTPFSHMTPAVSQMPLGNLSDLSDLGSNRPVSSSSEQIQFHTQLNSRLSDTQIDPHAAIVDGYMMAPTGFTILNLPTNALSDNLSTFAIDVDTGSYTVARHHIKELGSVPPWHTVRTEEFVNYFDYDYPVPSEKAFSLWLEGSRNPYSKEQSSHLMRVGIQGLEVSSVERPDALLIFVIDTSGSMASDNRLGLAKRSLNLMLESLRPTDRIGIVTYGDKAQMVLEPTAVDSKREIERAIDRLQVEGNTNLDDGIRQGYALAELFADAGQITRLILVSDGVANVGSTSAEMILENAADGVSLSTYGFGLDNYNDPLMEQLADQGDGMYAYIDTIEEAERHFVKGVTGTLLAIAKDAKIQVEFNPDVVHTYRLLGYENRMVADADFRNDRVGGGAVGSGHNVTAIYEVTFVDDVSRDDNAATVSIRYQTPESGQIVELSTSIKKTGFEQTFELASPSMQLAVVAAKSAEMLRFTSFSDESLIEVLIPDAQRVHDLLPYNEDVTEFLQLLIQVASIQNKNR